MAEVASDKRFAGSIPEIYETVLVPLIFAPYAEDLARRLEGRRLASVLEIAAGTGAVTRQLASTLPDSVAIVATDLNPPMIEQARRAGTSRPVEWQQADAASLPFADAAFDAVVCQFGAMFFPDKAIAFAEIRRVLRPGGLFLFNAWDAIEENEVPEVVMQALAATYPEDPPRFLSRTPHGYHDRARIAGDLRAGGFTREARFSTVVRQSVAASPEQAALAFCQGTPLRNEIEARDPTGLARATDAVRDGIALRFGHGRVEGRIQAIVVEVER